MMKYFLPILLALFLTLPGYSQDELPGPLTAGRYTSYFDAWDDVLKSPGDVVVDLTGDITVVDFLFDTFANFDGAIGLNDISVGTPTPISVGLILGLNRTVINNRHADKSFTVLDTFKIGVQPSFYYSTPGVTVGTAPYVYIEILDIRQVVPERYHFINPIKFYFEKLKKKIKKEEDNTPSLKKLSEDNELYFNFLPRNKKSPGRDARYGKLLNPVTSIFRLPLKHQWIKNIKRDEIISFSITGGVTFSACFGVQGSCNANVPKDFNWANAGIPLAEIGVFLEGKYQITVMREFTKNKDDNYVKVRVTKVKSAGVKFAAGSDRRSLSDQIRKVDGFIVYNMLGGILNIRPFSIKGEFKYSKFLNQTYRFNLNTEEGKEAYDKAVLGRFQLADKYSRDEKGVVIKGKKDAPVLRLLTKEEKRRTYRQESGIDLFLVKFWKDKTIRTSVIKQIDHQGSGEEETYFESLIINSRQMEVFFGLAHLEKRSHQFFIQIDDKKFSQEKIPKDAITVHAKVNHYDRFMTSKEYMRYVKEFEDNLGYPGLFPLPPTNREGKWDKLNLGSGSFSYNLEFNWEQIKRLVEYPEEKMWPALAKAFNAKGQGWETTRGRAKRISQRLATYVGTLPLSMAGEKFPKKDDILVANLKRERWKRLKKHLRDGPKKFNEKLAMFFNSGDYGSEMIQLLRVILPNAKVPYAGTARSKLFNNNKNWAFGDYARFMAPDSEENLEFAEDLINRPEDQGLGISNLKVSALGKLYLQISFDLESTPKTMFFNVDKKETFMDMFERSVETIVVENKTGFFRKPLFKKGHNKILFKISNKKHPLFPLAQKLDLTGKHRTRRYQLNVAASKDGKTFGHYDHSIFGIYPTQSEKFLDGFIEVLKKEENLCLGKAASELILFLGDKRYLVCPENAPKKDDGTCADGFTPYGHFGNRPLEDNLKRRDDWIIKNCPRLGSDQYELMMIEKENICQGKTGVMIIDIIGDDPFFVCPKGSPRNHNGFCVSGMVPYQWFSNKPQAENIMARNGWLMKVCGAKDF